VLDGRASNADARYPQDLAGLNPPVGGQHTRDRPGYRFGRAARGRVDLDPVARGQDGHLADARHGAQPAENFAALRRRHCQLLEQLGRGHPVRDA
jgi:hypothetical protein